MGHADFKRTKHGQLPGDLPKQTKIAMREKKKNIEIVFGPNHVQKIGERAAKGFRKDLAKRGNRRVRHQKPTLEA